MHKKSHNNNNNKNATRWRDVGIPPIAPMFLFAPLSNVTRSDFDGWPWCPDTYLSIGRGDPEDSSHESEHDGHHDGSPGVNVGKKDMTEEKCKFAPKVCCGKLTLALFISGCQLTVYLFSLSFHIRVHPQRSHINYRILSNLRITPQWLSHTFGGCSGLMNFSFFFFSRDGKYMIKMMTNAESKFLRRSKLIAEAGLW